MKKTKKKGTHSKTNNVLQNTCDFDQLFIFFTQTPHNICSIVENVQQMEQQMSMFSLRMVEMDLRYQLLEASAYNGILLWKITNYTLSEGLAHSTVHHHPRQLSVYLQSGAVIFIIELPGVILLFTNKDFK